MSHSLDEDDPEGLETEPVDMSAFTADAVLGRELRAFRRARGLSLVEVCARIGRSIGFLSQIERGLSTPSVEDLRKLAKVYDAPFGLFFGAPEGDPAERGLVVRADARRKLGTVEDGLVEELLSPDMSGDVEVLLSQFSAGAETPEPLQRPLEETGFVVSGVLEIELRGTWRRLEKGDSFRVKDEPFRWRNPGKETAVLVWVVSPPTY